MGVVDERGGDCGLEVDDGDVGVDVFFILIDSASAESRKLSR